MSGLTEAILLAGAVVGVAIMAVVTTATCLILKRRRRRRPQFKTSSFIGKELQQQLEMVGLTS